MKPRCAASNILTGLVWGVCVCSGLGGGGSCCLLAQWHIPMTPMIL